MSSQAVQISFKFVVGLWTVQQLFWLILLTGQQCSMSSALPMDGNDDDYDFQDSDVGQAGNERIFGVSIQFNFTVQPYGDYCKRYLDQDPSLRTKMAKCNKMCKSQMGGWCMLSKNKTPYCQCNDDHGGFPNKKYCLQSNETQAQTFGTPQNRTLCTSQCDLFPEQNFGKVEPYYCLYNGTFYCACFNNDNNKCASR